MKYKTIINYKSVYESYTAINPNMQKLRNCFTGIFLTTSIILCLFHEILYAVVFFLFIFLDDVINKWTIKRDAKIMMEKIEDLCHTNELLGEIIFEDDQLKVVPYGNMDLAYFIEYAKFKDFYIFKHYCVLGDKRRREKVISPEIIIIDKTNLTQSDMNMLNALIQEKMPQVEFHGKKEDR